MEISANFKRFSYPSKKKMRSKIKLIMREMRDLLEIRRTRGSEGGEHLRITDSLHSSPDKRHL